jgi:hypothetical protein
LLHDLSKAVLGQDVLTAISAAFEQDLNSPNPTGPGFEQLARCVERSIAGIVLSSAENNCGYWQACRSSVISDITGGGWSVEARLIN